MAGTPLRMEEELGDLLFSVVNLARKIRVDPEVALQRATDRFSGRFRKVETLARERGWPLGEIGLEQLDILWEEVKRKESEAP